MSNPKISVIIPTYNVEKYIERCVESVLGNTFKDFEVIIVNDGSLDGTYSILEKLAGKDERIRIFHKSNSGVSDARNLGMKKARGEYFTFIDGDDYVNERYLEKLYEQAVKNQAKLVITEWYRYNEKNNLCYYHVLDNDIRVEKLDQDTLLDKSYKLTFTISCAKLYHRSLFENVSFPSGSYYEDSYIMNKIYLQVPFAIYLVDNLYCYRITEGSIMESQHSIKKIEDQLKALEEVLIDLLLAKKDTKIHEKVYESVLVAEKKFLLEHGLEYEKVFEKINFRLRFFE